MNIIFQNIARNRNVIFLHSTIKDIMRKTREFVTALIAAAISFTASAGDAPQSVGLVLSGGGAKGIAHIGVIKALEDNDIPIDYITGTSMGAIVGGLYACGYTPEEMLRLIGSREFSYWSTGQVDKKLTYYFAENEPTPALMTLNIGDGSSKSSSSILPASIINPIPMNFGVMELFSTYTAQCGGNFDKLMVPFRCVASDVSARRAKVLDSGSLAASVHASMSFPLIFQATRIDGNILYDGGIYDNFPVDVMRKDFAPDIVLGFDVGTPDKGEPNSYLRQLELLVTEHQTKDIPYSTGMRVHVDLSDFGLLDFPQARAIYRRGYERTIAAMDSIKERIHSRTTPQATALRRNLFKSHTPFLRFDSVDISGGTRGQRSYLRYLFSPATNTDTLGISRTRLSYYRALSSEKFGILHPEAVYNDSTGLFRLDLQAQVKSRFSAGFGAYITSTNNSFLYLCADYRSLSFSSINTYLEAWIGQSYMAGVLRGNILLHSRLPAAFFFEGVAWRRRYPRNDRLFFRDEGPASVVCHQYFGKTGFSTAAGRTGAFDVGVGFGHIYNSFYDIDGKGDISADRSNISLNLGQAYAEYRTSTLDNVNYPVSGTAIQAKAAAVGGHTHYRNPGNSTSDPSTHWWLEAGASYRNYIRPLRHWALGIEAFGNYSSRPLMNSYNAALSFASCFTPTPSADCNFHAGFRANSYLAAGIVPLWNPREGFSLRFNAYVFAPMRTILPSPDHGAMYGPWFDRAEFFGELAANYRLPFANVSGYANYDSSSRKFNFGLSLGLYITAPSFL